MGQHEPISIDGREAAAAIRRRVQLELQTVPATERLRWLVVAWYQRAVFGAACAVAGYVMGAML